MPARPGAFTANFAPETLNKFRETCKRSGLQYTKVLEELATLYLESDGNILFFNNIWERLLASSDKNKELIKKVVIFFESRKLLNYDTKKELINFLGSVLSEQDLDPGKSIRTIQKTESRLDQLMDPSIDRTSPPDELTKWEEGYSDLLVKLQTIEKETQEQIRENEQTIFRANLNLKMRVAALEQQLSKLQSKINA